MSSNDGIAHEVEPGRLTAFEDAPDPTFSLIPRPGRTPRPVSPLAAAPEPPDTHDLAVEQARDSHDIVVAEPEPERAIPAKKPTAKKKTPSPAPDPGTKGPESKVRPSNVHIPVALLEPIAKMKNEKGLSNGEIIISAIEATYTDLNKLIHPAPSTGGNLFVSRRSRASRANDGPLTPLNYRLRVQDYATLDHLVDEFGASSRGHLITVALSAYLS